MARKRAVDIEVDHDRWLVSYADFVTLLFAFFVVMYSISQVNEGKYKVLSDELLEAFKVTPSAINPIQVGDPTVAVDPSIVENATGQDEDKSTAKVTSEEESQDQQSQSDNTLDDVSDQFVEQFSDLMTDDTLKIFGNELWLEIELDSSVLFASGDAKPSDKAKDIFADVATVLGQFNNPVQVEGFTDNVPISNERFNNNWELSSARAAAVVNLLEAQGIAPNRLSAVGYGEHRPVADNATSDGRAENRRVVLMISREEIERPRLGSNEAIQSALTPADQLSADDSDSAGFENQNAPEAEELPVTPIITPVVLDSGGLLFTSDPELQRNNLSREDDSTETNQDQN